MIRFIADYLRALRLFSNDVRMYLLADALIGLSFSGFVGVLLNLYLLRLDYGSEFIGLVNGGAALVFALSALPAGAIGDRWGYRRTVVTGVTFISTGTIVLPLAEFFPGSGQDVGILVSRSLSGLGFALYFVNSTPYLVAATEPQERDYVFSMLIAVGPLAGFIGSLIAGILPDVFANSLDRTLDHPAPFRYSLILAGLLLVPAIFGILATQGIVVANRSTEGEPYPNDRPNPQVSHNAKADTFPYILIGFLALTGLLRVAGEGAARTFFNVYLDVGLSESTRRIGLLTAIGQLLAAPAALAAPFLVKRVGKIAAIALSTLAAAIGLVLMGLIPHWAVVGLGFMGVVGMQAITQPIVSVVQMEIVPPRWRGTTSGVISMAMGMGFGLVALGGGYVIPVLGYAGLFLATAGFVAFGAALFWIYFRVPRGEYARLEYGQPQTMT
ncbi:MFS transporter [Chloroflexi bacterium TSY]|nr:MFS transporter [Chloroflexi bacterium TSY]